MPPSVKRIDLKPGELLYREGDSNECGYVVERGDVQLFREALGQRTNIETRGAGSILGEFSILTGQPRAVSVEAITPCVIYQVSSEHVLSKYRTLDPMLRACVEKSINFASTLVQEQGDPGASFRLEQSDLSGFLELLKMEAELSSGLDTGQFSMVYQPIVALKDNYPVGFEALMRWTHPKLGPISPVQFIPVAENLGSITKLTEFAILEACKAMGPILADGAYPSDWYVSVNVSGFDLDQPSFVDYVLHCLDLHGLETWNLRIEVTESALVPKSDVAAQNLKNLENLGVGICIDDFGTGYSNLGYLKRLPLKALKIDRSFVADASRSKVSRSIIRMLVSLGTELDVDIVAEGLETRADVTATQECGCGFAQGFHFHRPVPSTELTSVVAQLGNAKDVA